MVQYWENHSLCEESGMFVGRESPCCFCLHFFSLPDLHSNRSVTIPLPSWYSIITAPPARRARSSIYQCHSLNQQQGSFEGKKAEVFLQKPHWKRQAEAICVECLPPKKKGGLRDIATTSALLQKYLANAKAAHRPRRTVL